MFSAELLSVWIRIWFNMSLEDLPNAVAIVAKYSNSPLPVAVSVPVFHRAAVWQEKTLRWWRVEGLFSRTPYVVSFGGLLVSVYAWQVLAPFLCSWCLCTRLCHHPPAPLPLDLAQHNVSPPRQHEHKMKSKLNWTCPQNYKCSTSTMHISRITLNLLVF